MKSRAQWGWLGGVVVLGCIASFVYWTVRTPPRVGGDARPFAALPRSEQARRRGAARQLIDQVSDLSQSARLKEHKPFTLTATEEQLNTLLHDRVRTDRFVVRDLTAGLTPDQLSVQGNVDYRGFDVVATLNGQVRAREGKLVYTAQSLMLGGIGAPDRLKQQVERTVSERLNRLLGAVPGRIDSVRVDRGSITIQGVTN